MNKPVQPSCSARIFSADEYATPIAERSPASTLTMATFCRAAWQCCLCGELAPLDGPKQAVAHRLLLDASLGSNLGHGLALHGAFHDGMWVGECTASVVYALVQTPIALLREIAEAWIQFGKDVYAQTPLCWLPMGAGAATRRGGSRGAARAASDAAPEPRLPSVQAPTGFWQRFADWHIGFIGAPATAVAGLLGCAVGIAIGLTRVTLVASNLWWAAPRYATTAKGGLAHVLEHERYIDCVRAWLVSSSPAPGAQSAQANSTTSTTEPTQMPNAVEPSVSFDRLGQAFAASYLRLVQGGEGIGYGRRLLSETYGLEPPSVRLPSRDQQVWTSIYTAGPPLDGSHAASADAEGWHGNEAFLLEATAFLREAAPRRWLCRLLAVPLPSTTQEGLQQRQEALEAISRL